MRSFIRKFRILSLRGKVETLRQRSAEIAGRFPAAPSDGEKNRLARRYDHTLKRLHTVQHRLETLEREEREALAKPA